MASSTSNLDLISSSQAQKEVTSNALHDAASPATLFGRRASTTAGLTWGYYGGRILVDGVLTTISNGTVALTASATNYVEATRAGVVSKNTSGFTAGSVPLYTVVAGSSAVTSYTDERVWAALPGVDALLQKTITDANYTLTAAEARNVILEISGTLTAQRDIIVPNPARQYTVLNNTSGGFGIQVKTSAGSGIVIASAKRAIVYSDGTNVVRVSADT